MLTKSHRFSFRRRRRRSDAFSSARPSWSNSVLLGSNKAKVVIWHHYYPLVLRRTPTSMCVLSFTASCNWVVLWSLASRAPTRSAYRAVQGRHVETRVSLCRFYFAYGPGTGCVSGGVVPGWLAVESRPPPLINVRTAQKHKCSLDLIWVITPCPIFESENRRAGFETYEYSFPTVEQIITSNATQRSCRSTEDG